MRRFPWWARPWVQSLLRFDPRVMRRMPAALLLIAVGLAAWVFELGAVLQGQAQVRNWSSTWVGLDLMEITGLVLTSILLRRRSVYLSPVAAVTATLFGLDARFDVLTASAGADWYESLAAAFFGEIPMTVLLAALAIWAPRHITGRWPGQWVRPPTVRQRTPVSATAQAFSRSSTDGGIVRRANDNHTGCHPGVDLPMRHAGDSSEQCAAWPT